MSRTNRTPAYQEGRQANANGKDLPDNPYQPKTEEAKDWDDGWIFNEDSSCS